MAFKSLVEFSLELFSPPSHFSSHPSYLPSLFPCLFFFFVFLSFYCYNPFSIPVLLSFLFFLLFFVLLKIILDYCFNCCGRFVCVYVLVTESCLTLCSPMDCSLPGASVHVILQARYWSGLPFHIPGIKPRFPALQADSSPSESPRKPSSNTTEFL